MQGTVDFSNDRKADNTDNSKIENDSGLVALCAIASHYRIAADPKRLTHELAIPGRSHSRDILRAAKKYRSEGEADTCQIGKTHCGSASPGDRLLYRWQLWLVSRNRKQRHAQYRRSRKSGGSPDGYRNIAGGGQRCFHSRATPVRGAGRFQRHLRLPMVSSIPVPVSQSIRPRSGRLAFRTDFRTRNAVVFFRSWWIRF